MRFLGSFDSREKAAFVHEIAREKLKLERVQPKSRFKHQLLVQPPLDLEGVEAAVQAARTTACEAVGKVDS
jgi:hypothetical protein